MGNAQIYMVFFGRGFPYKAFNPLNKYSCKMYGPLLSDSGKGVPSGNLSSSTDSGSSSSDSGKGSGVVVGSSVSRGKVNGAGLKDRPGVKAFCANLFSKLGIITYC